MGRVAEITVPAPPDLSPAIDGHATQGPAYRLSLPTLATAPVVITAPDGSTLTWRPTELVYRDGAGNLDYLVGSAPVSVAAAMRQARYERLFPSADDVFIAEAERVKHYTVLQRPPRAPAAYLGDGIEFGVSGVVEYRDRAGVAQPLPPGNTETLTTGPFDLPRPLAYDLQREECHGRYEVVDGDEGQALFVWFPADWITDPDRPYPVVMDPTVINATTTSGGLGTNSSVTCANGNGVDFWRDPGTGTIWYAVSVDGWASTPPVAVDTGVLASYFTVANDDQDYIYLLYGSLVSSTADYFIRALTPNAGRTAWTVEAEVTVHNTSYTTLGYVGMVVNPEGSGWSAHCVYNPIHSSTNTDYLLYKRVTVSSSHTLTVGTLTTIASDATILINLGNIAVGGSSGKDLVVVWLGVDGIHYRRASYSSGTWTWGTNTTAGGTNSTGNIRGVYLHTNGDIDVVYRSTFPIGDLYHMRISSAGTITNTKIADVAANDDPVMTCDDFGNLYVYYETMAAGNAVVERYLIRSTGVWSPEAVIGTSAETAGRSPRVKKGNTGNAIDVMFLEGTSSPYSIMHYRRNTNADPLTPTGLSPGGGFAFDGAQDQAFSAVFTDGDVGAYATAYADEWQENVSGATVTQTGKVAITSGIPYAGQHYAVTRPAGIFANGKDWQWRRQYWDQWDRPGPFSEWEPFRTSAPPTASIISPVTGSTLNTSQVTVKWATSDPESRGQGWYRVRFYNQGRTVTLWDSGWVQSSSAFERTIGYTPDTLTTYEIGVQVRDADNIDSAEVFTVVTFDYTPPATPTVTVIPQGDQFPPYVEIQVSNPTPGASEPDVSYNRIERRTAGSASTWTELGTCEENDSYRDYSGASGAYYDYRAVAIGDNETESASAAVVGGIDRECWWFVPILSPDLAIPFAFNREASGTPKRERTEIKTRGPVPIQFDGGTNVDSIQISAMYVDPEVASPHSAVSLTREEWRQRFLSVEFDTEGYLHEPSGAVWKGTLTSISGYTWVRDMVTNALVVQIQFDETGEV